MKRPEPLVRPPGVLVPSFYVDPETKVFGCFVRPWEDILVEEIEEKMRPKPADVWRDIFKQEYLGEFMPKITPIDYLDTPTGRFVHYAKADAEITRRCYEALRRKSPNIAMNRPSPRINGVRAEEIIFDSINWAEIELRALATMPDHSKGELTFHIVKNRTPKGTCTPTNDPPPPLPIFRPSPLPSLDCEARASVIPRLLASSA